MSGIILVLGVACLIVPQRWGIIGATKDGAALKEVKALLARNNPEQAIKVLETLGDPTTLSSDALLLLIQSCYQQSDLDRALTLCDLMETRPDANPEFHFWRGNARIALWQASRAEAEFKHCLQLGVVPEGASLQLAKLYAMQARQKEVEPLIWELYTRGKPPPSQKPESFDATDRVLEPNLLVQLLIIQYFGWEAAAMIDQLQLFHEGDSGDFEAQLAYGRACVLTDRYSDAWELLLDCVQRRPDHAQASVVLLECALAMNDMEFVREWLADHREDFGDVAELCDIRGQILMRDDHYEQAASCFRQAVKLDPYSHASYHRLGRCLAQMGQRSEALEYVQIGRKLNLTMSHMLKTLDAMQSGNYTSDECMIVARGCHEFGRPKIAIAWAKIAAALGATKQEADALHKQIESHPEGTIVMMLRKDD